MEALADFNISKFCLQPGRINVHRDSLSRCLSVKTNIMHFLNTNGESKSTLKIIFGNYDDD